LPGIGTLNEKPLHAALKEWYAEPGDRFEVPMEGYVIDLVRGDLLIEIQTGGFSPLKTKLRTLIESHPVRLVHPIALEKWILKPTGKEGESTRRKSPRRGRIEDLFMEMVHLPRFLRSAPFTLDVLLVREEELRYYDDKRGWRRKGWLVEERRLLEVVESVQFATRTDWMKLLPAELDTFTTKDLSETMGIKRMLAQRMAYCYREAGLIEQVGKDGRSHLYKRAG